MDVVLISVSGAAAAAGAAAAGQQSWGALLVVVLLVLVVWGVMVIAIEMYQNRKNRWKP